LGGLIFFVTFLQQGKKVKKKAARSRQNCWAEHPKPGKLKAPPRLRGYSGVNPKPYLRSMFSFQNILVLAPHTDDGELGCGASLAKYAEAGKRVTYVAFSSCERSLPEGLPAGTLVNECRAATEALGVHETIILDFDVRHFPGRRQDILEEMVKLNRDLKPELVLLPARNDVHQDHQVIHSEGLRAFKNCSLLGYELPWNNTQFQPNYFERISEEHLLTKQNALKHYRSQSHRKYMGDEFIRSLAVVRGMQSGTELAEAFEAYKIVSGE
jgi:LmbE family N-acetylglucosaminyl deacetylase